MKDAKIDYFRIKEQNATAEAWLVEYTDKNVLYIPLHSLLIELTTKGRNDIRTYIDSQAMSGTMSEVIAQIQQSAVADTRDRAEEEYAPTVIGLGLTDICQLKCVYCHSDSGQEGQCSTMPFAVAKKAIDFAAQNAKKLNRPLDVGFIGPGEQTTVWELFTKVIRYIYAVAEETGIQTNLTLATNGCYGEEKCAFIVEHFDGVSLSFDGYQKIQNMQRPRKDGSPSFELTYGTAKYFYQHRGEGRKGFRFVLRPTVSQYGLDHIEELLSFYKMEFPGIPVGFEAINPLGRASNEMCGGKVLVPNHEQFAKKITELLEREGSEKILNSGASRLGELRKSFCKALSMPGFNITPWGEISACQRDGAPDFFKYGYYDSKREEFVLDEERIKYFRSLSVDSYPECAECIAKYHCAGDCTDLRRAGIKRCEINIRMVCKMLEEEVL